MFTKRCPMFFQLLLLLYLGLGHPIPREREGHLNVEVALSVMAKHWEQPKSDSGGFVTY
ncbi:hypothetical protein LEMLEM_LOCUS9834 [Lemmus lemmus]